MSPYAPGIGQGRTDTTSCPSGLIVTRPTLSGLHHSYHGYDFQEGQVPLPSYACSSLEQRNFNASDRGATGLASEPKGRNPVQTRLPATSGPHRDRLGVYPRSAPVAPIGSILQPLPDNRQELTWCPPFITDAIRLSATGDQRFVVLFS